MDSRDLEDEIVEAILRCCPNDEEKEKALIYFEDTTVCKMIERTFS